MKEYGNASTVVLLTPRQNDLLLVEKGPMRPSGSERVTVGSKRRQKTSLRLSKNFSLSLSKNGNLLMNEDTFIVLMTAEMFAGIFKGLESTFSSGAYTITRLSGIEAGKKIAASLQIPQGREDRIKFAAEILSSQSIWGWGKYQTLAFNDDTLDLYFRMKNLPPKLKTLGGEPLRFFFIGYFEGLLSGILCEPIVYQSTDCDDEDENSYHFHFVGYAR